MTRNGKIARLPRLIRDELNRRLRDGELGKDVVGGRGLRLPGGVDCTTLPIKRNHAT